MSELLVVKVTPRASRERIEINEGVVRVYVCSAPVDDAANEAVVRCLAKALGVAKSSVTIVKGHKSREKTLKIDGLAHDDIMLRLG